MSRSYDIFLSHSGAQKEFVEHLNAELGRVCGHYSVFFDRDAIQHGEQISTTILEYAKTCKLAVAVLSEEYFARSRWPMMELAASYTASRDGDEVPCLFPVFLALKPEDAKNHNVQLEWQRTWQKWEVNEKMSERRKSRSSRVQPAVWKEALDRLLDIRGPIYKPHENEYDPEIFLKKVAQDIALKVDVVSRSLRQDEEVNRSEATGMEDLGTSVNTTMLSANSPVIGEVADEEVIPEPARGYEVVVCLELGTKFSMFGYADINAQDTVHVHYEYPHVPGYRPSCRTLTGVYYYPGVNGDQLYRVKAWGWCARSAYERDKARARKLTEHTVGTYVTRFNPHLSSRDMEVSTTQPSFPHGIPVERPMTDYLREMGVYILRVLQWRYGDHLTMKMIQWCVPVPSSWHDAAKERMRTCMEVAGLVHGADGSPQPVKMICAMEAASLHCLRSGSALQWEVGDKLMVVDIGEGTFNVVVQELVSLCRHVFRVKELASCLFERNSVPDRRKFLELLGRRIGPCLQEFLTKCRIELSSKFFDEQWDDIKADFGSAGIEVDWEFVLPRKLAADWESYDRKMGYPERASYEEISISYRETQLLLDPAINEILGGIFDQNDKLDGVKAVVLVGEPFLQSPYVMSNIKQKLSRLVLEIIFHWNTQSAVCQGTVARALAHNLCSCASSSS